MSAGKQLKAAAELYAKEKSMEAVQPELPNLEPVIEMPPCKTMQRTRFLIWASQLNAQPVTKRSLYIFGGWPGMKTVRPNYILVYSHNPDDTDIYLKVAGWKELSYIEACKYLCVTTLLG